MDSIIDGLAFFVVAKNKPGGAERRFFYLCEHYFSGGKSPYLITNSELFNSLPTENLLDSNVFKMKLNGHKLIAPFKYILNSLYYIHKKNIKHVHFCVNPSFYCLFMVAILRLIGCTTSVSIVNSIIRKDSDLSPIKKFVWKKTIKSVDVIDILSPSIHTNMLSVFGPAVFHEKKISISLCSFSKGADLIRSEVRDDKNTNSKVYDFIFASRLIEGKGLDILLDALELCDTDGHNFTVAICGNGPLAFKVTSLKLNNIKLIYLGYVKDMKDVLLASKVALSLQKYENYPSQFLLEALAANCDIVSTDVGDTRLLLNENIATLIASDALSLKNSMISDDYDRSLERKLVVDRVLEQHSVKTFANYIEALITETRR